jgi:hypothetical protein
MLVVDLLDGVLELLVQYSAVRDHDDRVEEAYALGRAQADQVMRRPGDGAGLTAACGMLAQVGSALLGRARRPAKFRHESDFGTFKMTSACLRYPLLK